VPFIFAECADLVVASDDFLSKETFQTVVNLNSYCRLNMTAL